MLRPYISSDGSTFGHGTLHPGEHEGSPLLLLRSSLFPLFPSFSSLFSFFPSASNPLPASVRRLLPLALLLLAAGAAAQPRYALTADWPLTAEAGAQNVLFAQRATVILEERLLPARLWDEGSLGRKAAGIGYRLGRLVLLDYPLDHLAFLVQHEVFGHGARFREFGWEQAGYQLVLPWPYGDGSGAAAFIPPAGGRTRDEVVAAALHGSHASEVLAARIRRNALLRGRLHVREATLYLRAGTDLMTYVRITSADAPAGNDVRAWLENLNRRAEAEGIGARLDLANLKRQALLGLLDPALYAGLYAVLKTYLYDGDEALRFPMIPIGRAGYLPALRFGWSPFGSTLTLDNVLRLDGRVLRLYATRTDPTLYAAWGAGLEAAEIVRAGPASLDLRLDVWSQPALRLDPTDRHPDGSLRASGGGLGGAASATLFHSADAALGWKGWQAGFVLEAGYKTVGFVAGERLEAGPILRLGISLRE